MTMGPLDGETVCRHYAGPGLRPRFADEGLAHLYGPLVFRERWRAFITRRAVT
jgi:hypothetical protein